jgi:hypothetical protein
MIYVIGLEERAMNLSIRQPSLREMLDEPMVRLVMDRDGVTREEVEELVDHLHAAFVNRPGTVIAHSVADVSTDGEPARGEAPSRFGR